MMKYLQKLGKALMLPVAVLPICGILMGLGSVSYTHLDVYKRQGECEMVFHIAVCSPDAALRSGLERQCMEYLARRQDACIVQQLPDADALLRRDTEGERFDPQTLLPRAFFERVPGAFCRSAPVSYTHLSMIPPTRPSIM